MNKNKAFTLLELIVVIAIVGLLIAISVAFLKDAKEKGKDTAKINSMANVRKALQLYATDKGGFPSSTSTLVSGGYISSIDTNILYVGKDNSGDLCSTSDLCSSYHLAVPLDNIGNPVLSSDSNVIDAYINGISSDCHGNGTINLCYDITP